MLNEIVRDENFSLLVIRKKNGHRLECLVDLSDLPAIATFGKHWSADWSDSSQTYYVYCRDSERRKIYLHRWLLNAPKTIQVDHQDHNGLNNRRDNIRLVTPTDNQLNIRTPRNNTSGFRGVTWNANRGLWQAQVKVHKRLRNLGCFATKEQAHAVVSEYRQTVLGCRE